MKFELNEKEVQNLEELKSAVKLIHDDTGTITYSFVEGAIGTTVKVTFEKHNITKDITDYNSW